MEKTKLITILVVVAIALVAVNIFGTFSLSEKFNSITGKAIAQKDNTKNTDLPARIQASADDDPFKGSKDAPVTIIEFSDYQCPYCARFDIQTLPALTENYINTGKVKFIYRDFPLAFHKNAQKASEASECADEQGKFWEMHDKIFENQQALDVKSLKNYAKELSLDTGKFDNCLDSGTMASEVKKDLDEGSSYGVSGTPAFLINGILVSGALPFNSFQEIIEGELKG